MLTQATILDQKIAEAGWRIVQKTEMPDWWADEIWQLESIWSPVGRSAWITFLVDPQSDSPNRKKGQHVWEVALSAKRPSDRISNFEFGISLKSGWQKDLGNFIKKLNHIREIL